MKANAHIYAPTYIDVLELGDLLWQQQKYPEAARLYLAAAPLAPSRQFERLALLHAWCASERAEGRVSKMERIDGDATA